MTKYYNNCHPRNSIYYIKLGNSKAIQVKIRDATGMPAVSTLFGGSD